MSVINVFPIISTLLGGFLIFFILRTKSSLGASSFTKLSLAFLVFIYTLLSIGNYIDANNHKAPLWVSYLPFISFHFIGILFFYFATSILDKKINFKPYIILIFIYTILKTLFFVYLVRRIETRVAADLIFSDLDHLITKYAIYDYLVSCSINLFFIYKAYSIFKSTPMIVALNKKKEMYFKWIHLLFIINFFVVAFMMSQAVLLLFHVGSIDNMFKIETIIYTVYFFVFVYSLMHFPIFAYTGDYNDLPSEVKEKYKNSSLNNSEALFKKIDDLVQNEKMFLSSELKINKLSERLETSVPHISQAINENKNISFSDYINNYRILEAKKRLLVKKPDTIFAIAVDVGFNSKATFYHAFKKLTNTTPTQFRQDHF